MAKNKNRNPFSVHKSKKIIVTLLTMAVLMSFSIIMANRISDMEEEESWNALAKTAEYTATELRKQIENDRELLESIATIIEGMESPDSPQVQKIVDRFRPNTMISHIALLLPGDQVMLPNEPIRPAGGLLSFAEEAALGEHISDRGVDIRDESKWILRNYVPIIKDENTVAMLYGVVELENMPEKLDRSAYDGKVQITMMDAVSGDYLVDTWHHTLGNVYEQGERKIVSGEDPMVLCQMALEGKSGYSVFVSSSIGENLYFYSAPANINHWCVGIHVPESLVFARMNRVNRMLFGFIAAEMIVLAGYFFWILRSTRNELIEKQRLADTDLLTGLLNRNCYEKMIEGTPPSCRRNLACIYVDVNGLHELNNTKGHAAGDKMLQDVAKTLQQQFDAKNTYRIGGDEFVAFAVDEETEAIQRKLEEINSCLSDLGYHVSVGVYQENVPVEMDRLIKQAETSMYEEKRRYYQQKGVDRRRR